MGIGTELLLDKAMSSEQFEDFKMSLVPKAVKGLAPAHELEKFKDLKEKLEPLEKFSDALKLIDTISKETHEAHEHSKEHHGVHQSHHSTSSESSGRHIRTETAVRGVLLPLIKRVKVIED